MQISMDGWIDQATKKNVKAIYTHDSFEKYDWQKAKQDTYRNISDIYLRRGRR